MKPRSLAFLVPAMVMAGVLLPGGVSAEALDLDSYLARLATVPGAGIDSRVKQLERQGMTLSDAGKAELRTRIAGRVGETQGRQPDPDSTPGAASPVTDLASLQALRNSSRQLESTEPARNNAALAAAASTNQKPGDPATYNTFANGERITSQQVGDTTYHSSSTGERSTSQRVGDTTFHSGPDGLRGTSQTVGDTTFTDFSDGTRCVSHTVGEQTFTSCR